MTEEIHAAYRDADMKLLADDELYCNSLVKIKQKESGALVPFVWNNAQRKLHDLLEDQKRRTGKIRARVLKYRQGGISTYKNVSAADAVVWLRNGSP